LTAFFGRFLHQISHPDLGLTIQAECGAKPYYFARSAFGQSRAKELGDSTSATFFRYFKEFSAKHQLTVITSNSGTLNPECPTEVGSLLHILGGISRMTLARRMGTKSNTK
jgi:hypothetical protein